MKILAVGTTFRSLSLLVDDFSKLDGESIANHISYKDSGAVLVVGTITKTLKEDFYLLAPSSNMVDLAINNGFKYINENKEGKSGKEDNFLITIYNQKLQRHCYSYFNESQELSDYDINYSNFDVVFFCCVQAPLLSQIYDLSTSLNKTVKVLLPNGFVNDYFYSLDNKLVLKYDADFLFINEGELLSLCSREIDDPNKIILEKLILNDTNLIVTCGRDGVISYVNKKLSYHSVSPLTKIVHPGGAGDSFATAFIINYLKQKDMDYAIMQGDFYAKKVMQIESVFDLLKE